MLSGYPKLKMPQKIYDILVTKVSCGARSFDKRVVFAVSFFVSSILNLLLALWFFRGFDRSAIDALEVYNGIIGKLTGWGFAVIGIPLVVFLLLVLKMAATKKTVLTPAPTVASVKATSTASRLTKIAAEVSE